MAEDHVDRIVAQWRRERPDLDPSPIELVGRLSRLETRITPILRAAFARHGLEDWEFDVLATLRREGDPYRLSAGALVDQMMITSGSMTNRIDRLQARGLVRREKDPSDARVVLVALTPSGRALIDEAVATHLENEARIVGVLDARRRAELVALLRELGLGLDGLEEPG